MVEPCIFCHYEFQSGADFLSTSTRCIHTEPTGPQFITMNKLEVDHFSTLCNFFLFDTDIFIIVGAGRLENRVAHNLTTLSF